MSSSSANPNIYYAYDYHLITPLPIRPRRQLGDVEIDQWVFKDENIKRDQWEMLNYALTDPTGIDECYHAILEWDLGGAEDEEDEDPMNVYVMRTC